MVMPVTTPILPSDLLAVPTVLLPGDNIVRLAEAPGVGSAGFVFEFALAPEEKIEFKGKSRLVEIPIPQADGSILQSIGSEPTRITWNGIMEDVFSSSGALVRRAVDDVQTLDSMRLSGKVWILKYLDITHFVKIAEFNSTPVSMRGNLDRFEYDIVLTKLYPNLGFERPQSVTAFTQKREQQSALSGLRAFFASITEAAALVQQEVAAVSTIILTPITDFNNELNAILDQIEETGNIVNNTVFDAQQAITTPQRDLEQLGQRIDYNVTTLQQIEGNAVVIGNASQGFMIALKELETNLLFLNQLPQLKPNPPVTYVVVEGDRIEDIAEAFYGDFEAWRPIAEANNLSDPGNLVIGQTLTIPQ